MQFFSVTRCQLLNFIAATAKRSHISRMYCGWRKVREVTRKSHLTNRSCIWVLLSGSNGCMLSIRYVRRCVDARVHTLIRVTSWYVAMVHIACTASRYYGLVCFLRYPASRVNTWKSNAAYWRGIVCADAYTVSGRNAGNPVHLCRRRCTVATVTRLSLTTTSKALQKCVYGDKCVTIFCDGIRLTEKR